MKFLGPSLICIATSAYISLSNAFELEWGTTVEAPETPEEPTQQQKEHIQAVDDQAITIAGESVDIDVLANDLINSADPTSLSLSLMARGRNGYCVVHEETDFIVYYPKHLYAGYDECEYVVCDADKVCDSAKVTITVVKAVEFNEDSTEGPDRPAIDEILDGLNITGQADDETVLSDLDKLPITEDIDITEVNGIMHYSNDVTLDSFSCPYGQASITIEVQADKYGDDTTWTLSREYEDGTSEVELSGGPYDSYGFDSQHLCVPKPSKWLFTIADQYGDGAYQADILLYRCINKM
jgi:hypothetical protein